MVLAEADLEYAGFCAGTLQDPYPFFARLRATDPVHWSEPLGAWVLTRHDDIFAALSDTRLGYGRIGALMAPIAPDRRADLAPLEEHIGHWLGFTDPPQHTRLRKLVNGMFTPRLARDMRPHIQETVDSLLDEVAADGGCDVIVQLAARLPERIVYDLMDMPLESRTEFRRLVDCIGAFVGNVGVELDKAADDANAATVELLAFFRDLVDVRARHPGPDIVSQLAVLEAAGEITEQELLGLCVFIFGAGQTPFPFLATALFVLLSQPEAAAEWRGDPTVTATGMEELLRYESPLQILTTVAVDSLEIRGRSIRSGELLILALAAGNRDPDAFRGPDTLDIHRQPNRHLSFGWGAHYCLGASLTRIEAECAIGTALRRFPHLRLQDATPDWMPSMTERRLRSLVVEVG